MFSQLVKILKYQCNLYNYFSSVLCTDHNGVFFSLSIYHVSKSIFENIKFETSNVVILDPCLKLISFIYSNPNQQVEKNTICEYACIQVSNLNKILIDGKYCSNFTSNSMLNSKFFN